MMIRGHDLTARPRRRGPLLIDLLTRYVREGQEAGEIRGDEAPEDVAERLLGLIDGFSLHSLLTPKRLPGDRQVALLDQEFERLREGALTTAKHATKSHANRRRRTYA
jgi:BetI-type transcriptional repressor, C-terminal